MNELSLAEVFRFLLPGTVLWVYLYATFPDRATQLLTSAGFLGATLLLLVTGGLTYLVYRPLVYDLIIRPLQDITRRRSHNYRTYLMSEFGITREEAELCFSKIKDQRLGHSYEGLPVYSSAIHFLYIAAILALPFTVLNFLTANPAKAFYFLGAFILVFLAAFRTDRGYEDRELGFLSTLKRREIQQAVQGLRRYRTRA